MIFQLVKRFQFLKSSDSVQLLQYDRTYGCVLGGGYVIKENVMCQMKIKVN
jgi:hypothetical protein